MSMPLIVLVLAIGVALVYWRMLLFLAAVCLITFILLGIGVVKAEPALGSPSTGMPATSPVQPGPAPAGTAHG